VRIRCRTSLLLEFLCPAHPTPSPVSMFPCSIPTRSTLSLRERAACVQCTRAGTLAVVRARSFARSIGRFTCARLCVAGDLTAPVEPSALSRPPGSAPAATALHCTALHCTARHCTARHGTARHGTALHCTALHCTAHVFLGTATACVCHGTARHGTALHCTALHCTALHCTAHVFLGTATACVCTSACQPGQRSLSVRAAQVVFSGHTHAVCRYEHKRHAPAGSPPEQVAAWAIAGPLGAL
jgi:hypothetical protein